MSTSTDEPIRILRIKDWNEHFENNKSRILKSITWVPIPNKMDGSGYGELLNHPDGAGHFGAWCALIQIASRCDDRGVLIRRNEVLTPKRLGAISRIPASIFEAAIPRLIEIGWLESVSNPALSGTIRHNAAQHVHTPAQSVHNPASLTNSNGINHPALSVHEVPDSVHEVPSRARGTELELNGIRTELNGIRKRTEIESNGTELEKPQPETSVRPASSVYLEALRSECSQRNTNLASSPESDVFALELASIAESSGHSARDAAQIFCRFYETSRKKIETRDNPPAYMLAAMVQKFYPKDSNRPTLRAIAEIAKGGPRI